MEADARRGLTRECRIQEKMRNPLRGYRVNQMRALAVRALTASGLKTK